MPRRLFSGNEFPVVYLGKGGSSSRDPEEKGSSKHRNKVSCFLSHRLFYDYGASFIMQPGRDRRRNIQFAVTAYAYLKKIRS